MVFAAVAAVTLAAGACSTTSETLPEDISSYKLFRLAQDAYSNFRYAQAIEYYELIIMRFPDDRESVISAQYELALIHYKSGNKQLATEGFSSLLAEYQRDSSDYPKWVYVLSRKKYDEINDGVDAENN